jgi:ribulose-5-phosphate 4-epimerase/fuculose-1-phosphate aldolase
VIHSAVHEARPEAGCVLHTHTRAGVAVSAQKGGVLPISQQSTFVLGSLAYHDYEGVAFRDEKSRACRPTWAAPTSWCCATTAC